MVFQGDLPGTLIIEPVYIEPVYFEQPAEHSLIW
jgi:hypothetical protein